MSDDRAWLIRDDDQVDAKPDLMAILRAGPALDALRQFAARDAAMNSAVGTAQGPAIAQAPRDHFVALVLKDLRSRVAEQPLGAGVPPDDALTVVHQVQTINRIAKRFQRTQPSGMDTSGGCPGHYPPHRL